MLRHSFTNGIPLLLGISGTNPNETAAAATADFLAQNFHTQRLQFC